MRTHLLIAAFVAVALAGCADSDSSGGTGLSAAEGMQAAALEWNANATLVGLESFELRTSEAGAAGAFGSELTSAVRSVMKEPVGDGRSSLWAGAYHADGQHLLVYWSGSVLMQNQTAYPSTVEIPFMDATMDSDEAADLLLAENATWGILRNEPEAFGATQLFMADGQPHWYISGFANNFSLEGYVNAVTGEIVDGVLEPESFAGSFVAGNGGGFATFTIANQHQMVEMTVSVTGGDPIIGLGADITITDPTGEDYTFHVDQGQAYPFMAPGHAGEWVVYGESSDLLFEPTVNFSGFTVG